MADAIVGWGASARATFWTDIIFCRWPTVDFLATVLAALGLSGGIREKKE